MGQKQDLIQNLTLPLKEKGYKKVRQTWYKENSDLVILLSLQSSTYDRETYYIHLGIGIKKLRKGNQGLSLRRDISQSVPAKNDRGEFLSAERLIQILDLWEEWYGDLDKLRTKAVEGKLPIVSSSEAITFLTTVRLG